MTRIPIASQQAAISLKVAGLTRTAVTVGCHDVRLSVFAIVLKCLCAIHASRGVVVLIKGPHNLNADGCLTATGFPRPSHWFSSSHRSPQILFSRISRTNRWHSVQVHYAGMACCRLRGCDCRSIRTGCGFALQAGSLPSRPVYEAGSAIRPAPAGDRDSSASTLCSHCPDATAHPFLRFQGNA